MNTEILFLKNNLEAYFIRISQFVFGSIFILLGLFSRQYINWYFVVIGILYLFLALIIGSKKYSYLKFINSNLLYKKSFFHKAISIDNKSIININISNEYFVISTNEKKHKIYTSTIREYDAINVLPDLIEELKAIVNNNSSNLAT